MEKQIANDMETCGYTEEYRVEIKNPARPQLTYISGIDYCIIEKQGHAGDLASTAVVSRECKRNGSCCFGCRVVGRKRRDI